MRIIVLLLCLAVLPVRGELPLARLLTVFPPGARSGSTVEISVSGLDLDDLTQMLFSNPNITAIAKPGAPFKFVVNVASNAPPGTYDARVLGRFGITNPRAFVVGDLPERIEREGHHTRATAFLIPSGTIVNGQAEASAADFFQFAAAKDQRILIECAAKALDSRMEAGLILYDSSGRELERNRRGGLLDFTVKKDGRYFLKVHDLLFRGGIEYFYRLSIGLGPHLDFIFPPAGLPGTKSKYILYGRNLSGSAHRPITPGQPASTPPLQIDGKVLEQMEVELGLPIASGEFNPQMGNCVVEGYAYRLQTSEGLSNPILISFATAPIIAEKEPNDKTGQAISPPCEVVGQFYPSGDRDRFTFQAEKGAVYWAEVFSHRLGLATSPFLLAQRLAKSASTSQADLEKATDLAEVYGSESNLGAPEFKISSPDPVWRFEAPATGSYRIEVSDLFNRTRSDPAHVYRLSLRQETPDFQLMAFWPAPAPTKKDAREAHLWSGLLRRGETLPLRVLAVRRDNFKGEIEIVIEGLPPGISSSATRIEAEKSSALVLLTASEAMKEGTGAQPSSGLPSVNWSGPLRILGKAKRAGDLSATQGPAGTLSKGQLIREAHGAAVVWDVADYNTESIRSRFTREVVLSVSGQEAAPISIAAEDLSGGHRDGPDSKVWEVKAGSKARIPLRITRRGEFTETLKLKAAGIPALDSMKELEVDGKATNTTIELDLAQYKIPPGTREFYLQANTKGRYRKNPEGAQAADLAAKEAESGASKLETLAKQAAETLKILTKAARDAEAIAKAAGEKLSKATTAAEKEPDQQEILAAKTSAEAEAAEAAARASAASSAKVAGEKASAEARANAKEAETKKLASATRAKELAEEAKPKEVTLTVYSAPVRLRVTNEEKK